MLGHGADGVEGLFEEPWRGRNNSEPPTPELPREVNWMDRADPAPSGGKGVWRGDSFAVEMDVHRPTDINLLLGLIRCLVREALRVCGGFGGRRQRGDGLFREADIACRWCSRSTAVRALLEKRTHPQRSDFAI